MFTRLTENMFRHFLAFILFLLIACMLIPYSAKAYDLEKHIGLYKVVETKCELTKGLHNPCPDTKVFELDKDLYSTFFDSHEASYKWHIIKSDDGTFEDTMGGEVFDEDKIPIEHTSNCVSTHQGKHSMNFCDATLKSGALQLKIHGGLPAYSSSLLIEVKEDNKFSCFFKAVYPVLVPDLKWNILSKELRLKTSYFKKGEQIFGWLSVEFEETSTYKGEEIIKKYKIEGYIKPIIE